MFVDDLDLLSEDYEAVDHRLKLFLDVEVFEEEEELHSFIKVLIVTVRHAFIKGLGQEIIFHKPLMKPAIGLFTRFNCIY